MRDRYPSAIKRIIETEEGKPSMEDPIPQVQGADIDLHDDEVDRIDTFLEAVQTKFREYGLPPLKDYQREGTQFVIKSVLEYKCSLLGDEVILPLGSFNVRYPAFCVEMTWLHALFVKC